ncbi:MAG: hypothetical protein CL943_03800 [Candidatus Diapherotrites archaeon]|uniref:Thioredoxin-like fold domain-containing protein n=1 Tax=Candidatus Iainarchaeum sp. TaxID=3101447 RepID=A0A2D6M1W0_9ARCH|nr:hypothetical protein [Candidatus Diapherotrites archaeon]|tara:strand:+ start:546 stop:1631 length:1086 start_codon:yes stop_codon:yes gene_type:complete
MKDKEIETILYAGMGILLALVLFNVFTVPQVSESFKAKLEEVKLASASPKVDLVLIDSSCKECVTASGTEANLKNSDLNILSETRLKADSAAAKELIVELGIKRLPAIVLKGEVERVNANGFEERGETLVFDKPTAPYEDTGSGKTVGKVVAIILEADECEVCADVSYFIDSLTENGVFVGEEKAVGYATDEGKELTTTYSIGKAPALLLSDDIDAYPLILDSLKSAGLQAESGYYIIESAPPYIDVTNGETKGLIDIIYLADESCENCYDVMVHKNILGRFAVAIGEEQTIDVSSTEGADLIQDYNIGKVPAIVLKGELSIYPSFESIWMQRLGTREEDGSYVFREMAALGKGIEFKELG